MMDAPHTTPHPKNPAYLHHERSPTFGNIREAVFGIQDGMVSTLGAVTGIAVGSQDPFMVILAGLAIIGVESVSMGIGSYTSTLSEEETTQRILAEEKEEIAEHPLYERREMLELFVKDGWPEGLAHEMTEAAAKDEKLMLREMAYRELKTSPETTAFPVRSGSTMFLSYIVGGSIPLIPYFFMSIGEAITFSVPVTLAGLFLLGIFVSRYTKQNWIMTGGRFLFFGGVALLVGYCIGIFADSFSG